MAKRDHNGLPRSHYEMLAADYVEITAQEGLRNVIPKIAQKRRIKRSTVGSRIRTARRLGLLEPYMARKCPTCQQEVPRPGMEIIALEKLADDHADLCRRLARQAERKGHREQAGSLTAAIGHFERAASALFVAYDLGRRNGAIMPPR